MFDLGEWEKVSVRQSLTASLDIGPFIEKNHTHASESLVGDSLIAVAMVFGYGYVIILQD